MPCIRKPCPACLLRPTRSLQKSERVLLQPPVPLCNEWPGACPNYRQRLQLRLSRIVCGVGRARQLPGPSSRSELQTSTKCWKFNPTQACQMSRQRTAGACDAVTLMWTARMKHGGNSRSENGSFLVQPLGVMFQSDTLECGDDVKSDSCHISCLFHMQQTERLFPDGLVQAMNAKSSLMPRLALAFSPVLFECECPPTASWAVSFIGRAMPEPLCLA